MTRRKEPFYDVVIVGGGPAGSTAGYLLAKLGFKVVVIDSSAFPREKLCGGLITQKTLDLVNRIFNEDVHSLQRRSILDFRSGSYELFYNGSSLSRHTLDVPVHFVNRSIYDSFLLTKAKDAGADVLEAEKVVDIDLSRHRISTSAGTMIQGSFIVGADGANSTVRRAMPILQNDAVKWRQNLAIALQVFVDRNDTELVINHPIIFLGFLNWGYSWVFPNRDRLVVGMGGLPRANRERFVRLFTTFVSAVGLDQTRTSKIHSWPVPFGNFLRRPVFGNTLLIGDAAGLVNPLTGEGIFYAHKSAELASQAIQRSSITDEDVGKCYLRLLHQRIHPGLKHARRSSRLVYGYFVHLPPILIKAALGMFSRQILASLVHSNGVRR